MVASNRASKKLPFPGSLYKDRNGYYIYQLSYNYKRKQVSTSVKDYKLAVQTARKIYPNLFNELRYPTKQTITFKKLIEIFLKYDHNYSLRTIELYTDILTRFSKLKKLPPHPTTRSIWVRTINRVINWGNRQGYLTDQIKYSINETNPRTRILSSEELQIFKDRFTPCIYKNICMISLLTGARQMELLSFDLSNKFDNYIIVHTKTKKSIKKKAIQLFDAKPYINKVWSVSRHQLNKYWGTEKSKHINEFGLFQNLQFRDLRRTFAVTKLLEGYSILEISKLMGHDKVATTELYLKPFEAIMITAPLVLKRQKTSDRPPL